MGFEFRPDQIQHDAHVMDYRLAHNRLKRHIFDRSRSIKRETLVKQLEAFGYYRIYNSQISVGLTWSKMHMYSIKKYNPKTDDKIAIASLISLLVFVFLFGAWIGTDLPGIESQCQKQVNCFHLHLALK